MAAAPGSNLGGEDGSRRALRILAGSLVRELRSRGYELRHIVLLAGELVDLAAEWVRSNGSSKRAVQHGPSGPSGPSDPGSET